jgi:dTDP-glucose 4,6-dehydratase
MRYFVTGGLGFIGSNYVNYLFDNVNDVELVTVFDKKTYASSLRNVEKYVSDSRLKIVLGDICDYTNLLQSMKGHDVVVNFAAESHVDRSITSASIFTATNILGAHNVLEAARVLKILTTIQVSTDEVYGSLENGSASELYPLVPNSPYAASKASADLIARSYFVTHGMDVRVTRSCNNYGNGQYPEKVIPVFIRSLLQNKKIPIYGSGLNVREWIHVLDNCKAIQLIVESGIPGDVTNIGSGYHLSNLELAYLILDKMSPESKYRFVPA